MVTVLDMGRVKPASGLTPVASGGMEGRGVDRRRVGRLEGPGDKIQDVQCKKYIIMGLCLDLKCQSGLYVWRYIYSGNIRLFLQRSVVIN